MGFPWDRPKWRDVSKVWMLSSSPTPQLSTLLSWPPSTLCPLSLLLSGPLYHSFCRVVALKPLANVSMSLSGAGQGPASPLPPGCALIDGPPLGDWQAAFVSLWRAVWQLGDFCCCPCVAPTPPPWAQQAHGPPGAAALVNLLQTVPAMPSQPQTSSCLAPWGARSGKAVC